ncbi:MAG: sigma 54-interacting transcriptional regulator [Acidobacteriota bacterium]
MNGEGNERHLAALQSLLDRDYLATPDPAAARVDLASMVKEALGADAAMVASWDPATQRWSALTSEGKELHDSEISELGSRSILEVVRTDLCEVLKTSEEDPTLDSWSIRAHRIGSYLGVPLFFREIAEGRSGRIFGGCLYAHRTWEKEPFRRDDVAIARDIARIVQPTLNVLRYVKDVETRLRASNEEVKQLREQSAPYFQLGRDGTSVPRKLHETLSSMAQNQKVTLLVLGPPGAGKSHLAQAYHYACPRKDRPFIVLDCGTVSSELTLAADLFGYAPNSGYANAPKGGSPGKARLAEGGTLFVDEIGYLSLELQPKLLRIIREGRFTPLGGSTEETTDIQLIAATNVDLKAAVANRTFREDLYQRINVFSVTLPGLSDRIPEIPSIARTLLSKVAREAGKDVRGFSEESLRALMARDWSREGNVAGLENLIRRSVWIAPPGTHYLDFRHLSFLDRGTTPSPTTVRRTARLAEELGRVKTAIHRHGNARDAAKALGKSYRELYWILEKSGLRVRDVLDEEEVP